jgi:hypothetical protein
MQNNFDRSSGDFYFS